MNKPKIFLMADISGPVDEFYESLIVGHGETAEEVIEEISSIWNLDYDDSEDTDDLRFIEIDKNLFLDSKGNAIDQGIEWLKKQFDEKKGN